jgi:hypothetical protein
MGDVRFALSPLGRKGLARRLRIFVRTQGVQQLVNKNPSNRLQERVRCHEFHERFAVKSKAAKVLLLKGPGLASYRFLASGDTTGRGSGTARVARRLSRLGQHGRRRVPYRSPERFKRTWFSAFARRTNCARFHRPTQFLRGF